MKTLIVALMTIVILTSGCVGYGNVTKNLSQDGAIIRGRYDHPAYGSFNFLRVGDTTNKVVITPDGAVSINDGSFNGSVSPRSVEQFTPGVWR